MFERFTDRGRRVIVLAQEEATLLDYNYIGSEHILLGLLHEGEGVAAQVLIDAGCALGSLRERTVAAYPPDGRTPGHTPFTPGAKKVIELSLREALQLGHNYIGTEHVLLAIVCEVGCPASQLMQDESGRSPREMRQAVIQKLSGYRGSEPKTTPSKADPWGDHLRRQLVIETERPRSRFDSLRRQLDAHEERRSNGR